MFRFVLALLVLHGLILIPRGRCVARAAETTADGGTADFEESDHWSFQPRVLAPTPKFTSPSDQAWAVNPIDAFILHKLRDEGLSPSPAADRRTLVRRVYFDLTGLPPSPDAVRAFVDDDSPDAYPNLIEQLLASPRYGERWGQHWLDVVRFSETEGFEYDHHRPYAWRFRDYVIAAFNADKPYDRFIIEQLAGDELSFTTEETQRSHEAKIAAGFHRLGPVRRNAGNPEVAFSRNEVLTEMIDIVGSAFLGLTLGCARCHDHMFDPIPQRDYYQMQAFLSATHEYDVPLADEQQQQEWKEKTEHVNSEIERINKELASAEGEAAETLREELKKVKAQMPALLPVLFSVKNDFERRTPIHLLERGDEFKKGEPLNMRTLSVLNFNSVALDKPSSPRPKTALAEWVADSRNPLTARVMANRVWHYHFGRGIVNTMNDFGINGEEPSHPELLDYLAEQFVQSGWSVKSLHRMILLSNTYRQSAGNPDMAVAMRRDPENRLLWCFQPRRLEAEEIRDAMLAASGRLNLKMGGESVIVPVEQRLVGLLYKPSQWQVTADPAEHDRRSVYLIAKRNLRLPFLEVFDQPDLQTSCGRRVSSTHAPQALEMLNGRLSNDLANSFAERLQREAGEDVNKQVELAFLIATAAPPSAKQRMHAVEFLRDAPLREFALAMFSLNKFLYVD